MKYFFLRLLVVLLLFLFEQKSYAQQTENNISSKDYYNFFNSLVNPDSIHHFNLESKPDFSYILRDTAIFFTDTTLFTPADIQFIKSQMTVAQDFRWESNKILGARVISSKKIEKIFKKDTGDGWTEFKKKYKNGFATFSIPLFTVDKNTCIIYRAEHCGGLCGHGSTSVYKKINGKWIFIQSIGTTWIS